MTGPTAHAALGASSAHRWVPCPGSIRLTKGIPTFNTIHSLNGTAAHAVGELRLQDGKDARESIGDLIHTGKDDTLIEVTEEMADAVQVYLDYCRMLMSEEGAKWWTEAQVSLEKLDPPAQMFGTSDFAIYKPFLKELEVVDYKHGSGVLVEVKGNLQTRYYGLGTLLTLGEGLDVETVKMTIVQPRAAHPDGPIRSETITVAELIGFASDLMDAAKRTQEPDAPLVPGKHCRWCPASAVCPAQREHTQALAQVAFDDMPVAGPPAPETLSDEVFADMLAKMPILEDWARAMYAHAQRKFEAGEDVPGFKMVAKRATRRWVDEDAVVQWYLDSQGSEDGELYIKKLKSPAQVEKLVGKKNLPDDLYEKRSSGYTMVPESDPRPALALGAEDVFTALPAGG